MHKIKKAIIPVAGLGTRMYPMNKVTKKAFLPIVDQDNRVKPVLLKLLEELDESGMEEIFLIIGKEDELLYKNLFTKIDKKIYDKLCQADQAYEEKIEKIGKKINYIVQEKQLGFGHAVFLAKKYIGNEPCLLVLGDTIYKSNEKTSCMEQLLNFYDIHESVIIALQELREQELKSYGTVYGTWDDLNKTHLSLQTIVEKPSIEYAKKHLLLDGKFYGNFGEFVLTKELFDELEKVVNMPLKEQEEYQLMDAFEQVIKKGSAKGLIINGTSFDAGNINAYVKVMRTY